MAVEYVEIAKKIADKIRNGEYSDTLPSINTLSKLYGICPATVTRVITQLKEWDMVSGEQGRCTRINPKATGNHFFHKHVVILIDTQSMEYAFYNRVIVLLNKFLDRFYITYHIFVSENQFLECGFSPDCVIVISQKVSRNLLNCCPYEKIIKFNYAESGFCCISTDNRKAGYLAVKYLAEELGHKEIGILTTQLQYNFGCFKDRFLGVTDYAEENKKIKIFIENITEDEVVILPFVENLLQKNPGITAVFASGDSFALGVYAYAAKYGLKIPEDLTVIGFDNSSFSETIYPALTTFHEDHKNAALQMEKIIKDIIMGRKPEQNCIAILPELILRNSHVSLKERRPRG